MRGERRLRLVPGGGGQLAGDAAEAGFAVLLEIWHSATAELVREMSPDQLRALLITDRAGLVPLRSLGEALGVSPAVASRISQGLEAAGLVRRSQGAPGQGVVMISVTASGRRLAARIREQRRAVLDHVLQSLSPVGRESLTRALSEFAASPA